VCDEGWGGVADFDAVPGRFCGQPLFALRIVCGVMAALGLLATLVAAHNLVRALSAQRAGVQLKPLYVRLFALATTGGACLTTVYTLKSSDPQMFVIGDSMALTLLWYVGALALNFGLITLLQLFFRLSTVRLEELRGQSVSNTIEALARGQHATWWLRCTQALSVAVNFPILMAASVETPEGKNALMKLRFALLMLTTWAMLVKFGLPPLEFVVRDLTDIAETLASLGGDDDMVQRAKILRNQSSILVKLMQFGAYNIVPPLVIFVPLATRFAVLSGLSIDLCFFVGFMVAMRIFDYSSARVEPRPIASTLSRKEKSVTSRQTKDQLDRQQSLKSSRIGSGGPSSKVVPSEAS
jgi:hypothetical protein